MQKSLDELIRGGEIVKAVQRDGILHPGIVGIEGDEIADAHVTQLPQGKGAVQGLPAAPFVLPALIEEGHDDIDSVGLAVAGGDDALQVLVMIVRGHMVRVAVHIVCNAVVADIYQQKQVFAADGLTEEGLSLPASETGRLYGGQVVLFDIALEGGVCLDFVVMDSSAEFHEIVVDSLTHLPGGRQRDNLQRGNGHGVLKLL